MRKKLARKLKAKKEAIEIIPELLKRSKESYRKGNKRLSKVQSKKIKYLTMKYKLKLPKELKKQLCKNCSSILIPSVNCRVRTNKGKLVYYCMECKRFTRMPLR